MNANIRASSCAILASVCLARALVDGGGGFASAAPTGDAPQASCTYTLSEPFVVEVSGSRMVSATLTSFPCRGDILPNTKTVCVELKGLDGPSQCASLGSSDRVQVYFAPYRPGATYVSTGIGCGAVSPMLTSVCATQGPRSIVL